MLGNLRRRFPKRAHRRMRNTDTCAHFEDCLPFPRMGDALAQSTHSTVRITTPKFPSSKFPLQYRCVCSSTCPMQLTNPLVPVDGGNCIPFALPGQCVREPMGETYFRTTCASSLGTSNELVKTEKCSEFSSSGLPPVYIRDNSRRSFAIFVRQQYAWHVPQRSIDTMHAQIAMYLSLV